MRRRQVLAEKAKKEGNYNLGYLDKEKGVEDFKNKPKIVALKKKTKAPSKKKGGKKRGKK